VDEGSMPTPEGGGPSWSQAQAPLRRPAPVATPVQPVRGQAGRLRLPDPCRRRRLLCPEPHAGEAVAAPGGIHRIAANPRLFAGCEDAEYRGRALDYWLIARPELRYLVWSCTDEVAIGQGGTPIRFDVALSPTQLEGLRFRSRRGERGLKYIEGGRLTKVLGLDGGVYRLSPESAALFARLVGASQGRPNHEPQRVVRRRMRRGA
jgi:hypothetical protein